MMGAAASAPLGSRGQWWEVASASHFDRLSVSLGSRGRLKRSAFRLSRLRSTSGVFGGRSPRLRTSTGSVYHSTSGGPLKVSVSAYRTEYKQGLSRQPSKTQCPGCRAEPRQSGLFNTRKKIKNLVIRPDFNIFSVFPYFPIKTLSLFLFLLIFLY